MCYFETKTDLKHLVIIAVFGLLVFAIPIQQGYGLIFGVSEFFDERPNLYRIGSGVRDFVQDPKDTQCTNPRFEIKDTNLISNPTKKLAETEGNFFIFLNEHGTDSYRYLKAVMPEGNGQPRYYGYVYDENNNKVTGFGVGLDSGSLVTGIETFGKDAVIDEEKRLYDFMDGKSKFGGLTKTAKQGEYRTNIVLYHYEQPRTEKKACTIVIDWEFSVNEKGEFSTGDVHARTGALVDVTAQFSPRQQSDLGMESFSIQCKEGYQKLSQKEHQFHDGRTACVTPETKDNLIERGWTTHQFDNKNTESITQKNDGVLVYPIFSEGVTEIINPEHSPLKYKTTIPVIDETYLSRNAEQWQDAPRNDLEMKYEKYGDEFYIELGRLLMP